MRYQSNFYQAPSRPSRILKMMQTPLKFLQQMFGDQIIQMCSIVFGMRTKAGPCLGKYLPKSFKCKIITDIFGGDLKFTSQGCLSNHLTSKT